MYITPEKLGMGNALDRLSALHQRKPLLLLAIDEAHLESDLIRPHQTSSDLIRPTCPICEPTATACFFPYTSGSFFLRTSDSSRRTASVSGGMTSGRTTASSASSDGASPTCPSWR